MKAKMIICAVMAAASAVAGAAVIPAVPFTDNMVLQRGMRVPVWGTAQPGENVTVSFAGQTKRGTAGTDGRWRVDLDPMAASKEPRTLVIGERKISNVLVGEVWLASGQSNMEDPILGGHTRYRDGYGQTMTAFARRSDIRFYTSPQCRMKTPNLKQKIVWRDFSAKTFKDPDARVPICLRTKGLVSAVGFYYALAIHDAIDVPVGLVDVSWGGSRLEPWVAPGGEMWNGMVAAFAPMACRGFIWYQGCSNVKDGAAYKGKMHALYKSWAKAFCNPDLKMYFVQLAPFNKSWYGVQLAQARFAAEEKNAGMAVTCDLGNPYDIHPNAKEPVARRLALHALKDVYGFDDVIADSPTLKSSRVDAQGRFVLEFNDATSWYGYTPDNAAPGGFEIAGEDGVFHPAHVANSLVEKGRKGKMYEGRELIVASDKVKSPRRLRYLYSKPWVGSLYSGDSGLPLGPFEVDVSFASAVLPIEEWLPVTFGQTKGGTYRLDGKFLDARIYSRALSDAEAAAYSKATAGAVSIAREGLVWEGVPTPGDRCDAVKKADYSKGFTFACRVILNKTGGRLIDNTTGGCDGWLIDTWPDRPRFYCCGKRVGDHKRQFAIGRAQSLVATLKDGKTSIWLDGERCDYSFDPSILRRTTWNDLVEKKAKPLEWIFPTGDETPQEGMRFADGVTGVLAWGGGDTVKLTVGRADLWDRRGGYGWTKEQSYTNITDAILKKDKARLLGLFKKETPPGEPRNPYILPLGRIELKIPGATLLRGALDVKTGVGTIDFLLGGATNRAELAMSKESHAFAIKLPEGTKCEAKAVHCMEQPAVKSALDKLSFKPAKYTASGFTWELPADESVTLAYVLKGGELSIATWRGGGRGATALPGGRASTRAAIPSGTPSHVPFAKVKAESTAHWTKFWAEGARVKVPDPVLQGLFDYGMYCFGCMTDPEGVPCGLQGAWLEDNYIAPWSADYHFNINVQECYSPAYRGGHFANMMPLFRMVLGWKPLLRDNARKFADVDGYVLPHSVSDRGVNIGGFWTGTIDHGSTAWVADMMFRYVKYSRDVEFLHRDAYDFMKGAMRVYRAMMVEDGKGGLAFPTGPSPEWGGATFETAVGRNPSFQLAAAHRLARNLIAAAALLGESPDPMWLDVEKRLPLAAIDDEKGGIMLFENRPFSASHRHHSHLAGLFPFDIFDLDDPATATTVKKTYATWDKHGTSAWTGWCVPWAAVLNVHAGRAEQAVKLLHDFDEYFTNPGHAPRCYAWKPGFCQFVSSTPKLGKDRRYLGHEVLDMDGLLSACAAVMEMMAHEVNGKTEFFRGCPPEWKEVSFENLALSDGRRVSGRRVNGKVEITAP